MINFYQIDFGFFSDQIYSYEILFWNTQANSILNSHICMVERRTNCTLGRATMAEWLLVHEIDFSEKMKEKNVSRYLPESQ